MSRTPCRKATARKACSRSASPARPRIFRCAVRSQDAERKRQRRQGADQRLAVRSGADQVLQASVTGLEPKQPYVLALAAEPNGEGALEPLAAFMTNPAGRDRQRHRPDPADRAGRGQDSAPLSGDRGGSSRQARPGGAGAIEVTRDAGRATLARPARIEDMLWALFVSRCDFRTRFMWSPP